MRKVLRDSIVVEGRQRSGEHRSLRDRDLRDSIETKGLLHPIVLTELAGDGPMKPRYRLIAGGRRLAALDWIAEDGLYFLCDTETILPGEIPAILLSELSAVDLMEAELEENTRRLDLPWQDRIRAIDTIHNLRKAANPTQTIADTAREQTKLLGRSSHTHAHAKITEATIVAKHLDDPAIKNARNANEAFALVVKKEEAQWTALMVKQRETLPATIDLRLGDCLKILPTIEAGIADLVIADPPYAIGANEQGFRGRTVHHHNYDDSVENAKRIITACLVEGFRITKPRANVFIFSDIDLWTFLGSTAEKAGWTPFRTPIIWAKSESEGLAPWGRQGFRRTYEIIFFATKGQRGLISSPVDILRHSRVPRAERDYGAAKPVPLYRELIECATIPNDLVIDPCCGSGGSMLAAKESRRRGIGIEQDTTAFNLAMAKIGTGEENNPDEPPISNPETDINSL